MTTEKDGPHVGRMPRTSEPNPPRIPPRTRKPHHLPKPVLNMKINGDFRLRIDITPEWWRLNRNMGRTARAIAALLETSSPIRDVHCEPDELSVTILGLPPDEAHAIALREKLLKLAEETE